MSRWAAASLLAALLAAGCDNTFEPIDPGGPPFSVFGYLDASRDTQWIRVTPLRTVLRGSADPTGIAVTLEELGSGRILELRDSAMRYPNMLGSDSLYAHSFWTAERIEPAAAYRFRAVGTDGALAESVVQVPHDYAVEVWVRSYGSFVRTEGLKQLVFVFWNTYYYDGCLISRFFRKIQYVAQGGDSQGQMIPIPDYRRELPTCGRGGVTITRQDAELVGSDTPWPQGQDYSTWRLAPDSAASNVTGALGFLAGVLTKRTRAESCVLSFAPSFGTPCKLRYDSTTATLRGTVSSTCAIPPDSVRITLQELAAPSGEPLRTRFGILDPAGSYDIGALRPGIPHRLTIAVGDTTGRYHPLFFQVVYDTLQFTAGQVTTHHATLEPIGPCPRL